MKIRRLCRAWQDYEPPSGELLRAIESDFGSLDHMVSIFNPKTAAVQVRALACNPYTNLPRTNPWLATRHTPAL